MAYEVTATRKRPQSFGQMAGQDFVVTTLKASLTTGRIAHAYLFSGPRGVGKTSAARILARSLNCQNGPTESPCGECDNCLEIAQGNSLDVIEIDGASNTSVNDVREIKNEVLFTPNSSRYKIYIIDEVHMLSNSAFNALLKTIEEPPPYVIFVFATTEVHKVPATIRSRCQQFNFRLISIETIKGLLSELVAEMGIEAEEDALFWIAKEATGSLRDAYTLFDQIVSFSDTGITLELIREKLGLVGLDRMNDIAEHLVEGRAKEAMEIAEDILVRGVSVDQFVVDLAEYFRCVLFIRHGIRKESLLGFTVERFSEKVCGVLSDVQIEKGLELVFQLYRDLRYSLNQRFELELLLSRLSQLTSFIHQKELLGKIATLRRELQNAGVQVVDSGDSAEARLVTSADAPAAAGATENETDDAAASGAELTEDSPGVVATHASVDKPVSDATAGGLSEDGERSLNSQEREAIMSAIRKKHLSLASSLDKVLSWQLKDDSLLLTCPTNFDSVNIQREQQKMLDSVAAALGRQCRIKVRSGQDGAEAAVQADDGDDVKESVEMMRRVFRGEIVGE
jgi:DNA polymerase III subunit gamma/tau